MSKDWKKIILIILFFIILIFGVWFFVNRDKDRNAPAAVKPAQKLVVENKVSEPENYSRVSFFHAEPLKCSLAIPEEWEGKYRVKTLGKTAVFYYIANPESQAELFYIKTYPLGAKYADNEEKILEKNKSQYTYSLSTVDDNILNKKEFAAMQNKSRELIKTLKCFSLE